jgi:multicomponent Na+:H+ antiporter subunit D
VLIAAGAATSLLTLYALARAWSMAFWRNRKEVDDYDSRALDGMQDDPNDAGIVKTRTISPLMVGATTALLALTVSLTVFAGPVFDLAARAAADIESPQTYIDAVFPNGVPAMDGAPASTETTP